MGARVQGIILQAVKVLQLALGAEQSQGTDPQWQRVRGLLGGSRDRAWSRLCVCMTRAGWCSFADSRPQLRHHFCPWLSYGCPRVNSGGSAPTLTACGVQLITSVAEDVGCGWQNRPTAFWRSFWGQESARLRKTKGWEGLGQGQSREERMPQSRRGPGGAGTRGLGRQRGSSWPKGDGTDSPLSRSQPLWTPRLGDCDKAQGKVGLSPVGAGKVPGCTF